VNQSSVSPSSGAKTRLHAAQAIHSTIACVASLLFFLPHAFAAPGLYDPSFNGAGVVLRDIGPGHDIARAVAVQPDGKIVVAGGCSETIGFNARDWCITRFLPNGAIDNGFGTSGLVQITAFGDQYAAGVAIAPDDSIVVTGTCDNAKFCAYRVSSSGGVFVNFGVNGLASFAPPNIAVEASAMLLQPDGRIVVGGLCANSALVQSICLARFNRDGSFDSGFGNVAGGGTQFGFFPGQAFLLGGLALQGDGKIVYSASLNITGYNFTRGRLNANGTFDGTYQTGVIAALGTSSNIAASVALQADGKALLGGYCSVSSTQRFCVARVQASDGALDTTYGVNGFFVAPSTALNGGAGKSIVVQPDGKAILSGTWSGNFAAIRLDEDGNLDATWAGTGYTFGAINNGDFLYASALQRDGKLIWAGQCTPSGSDPRFCVQRLDGGPFGSPQCVLDIDGDGRVLGTTDMLILSRAQRGVTGPAVIGGIAFAPHATRNTWPLVQSFLASQCGLSIPG
jgi:uncharacterized delta-60 repeat protein